MLLMRWCGCACGGNGQGLMLLMRWCGCACGGLEVKRAGANAADALVWVCLWGPGGETGRC